MSNQYRAALLRISVVSFVLNAIWENAHAPLYAGYISPLRHVPMCTRAAFGDVLIVLLMYGLFTLMYKDAWWFKKLNWKSVALLGIVGLEIGVGIEIWALHAQRWNYGASMPIIPRVQVGLTPVLQMMLLPIITFYLSAKYHVYTRTIGKN